MCDQTEVIYSPNDVVWVKLGPVWWPGRVCSDDEVPPEIMKDLRKTPIAIVKFFQEDSFEYVKSLSNIYHYHCARKNEFIKKGLDMLRSKKSGAPSNMKLFPEDIVRAEHLTHGNPAILQNDMFLPEEKPAYTNLFASNKKLPKKVKADVKKKQSPEKPNTPRLITHPRFLQLSSGQSTDYEVRERKQMPVRAECDEEDTSPPTLYTCTECDYTTTRLNVMVWHNKSHTRNYASPQLSGKATKRKSTASLKLKERSSSGSPSVEPKSDTAEEVRSAKIPKTNGTLKVTSSPKTPGRKKRSTAATKTPVQSTPHTKEANSTSTVRMSAQRGRRGSTHKGDEIHKSLLDDWLEDDIEPEESATDENSMMRDTAGKNTADSATRNDSKRKSCFDFDDSEDHLVIDESKFKPGRKIPRLLNKSAPLTIAADDVVAMQDLTDAIEVKQTIDDSNPKYQSGVEDSMDGELSLSSCQTSQLQEMGVDNEIEIKTEEIPINKVKKRGRPKKIRRNLKTKAKASDPNELHDQVDKLLNEISKAPAKLPDIPRSHKKAQLKAYQQQAEAEEQAAQKTAAEAETARKATVEAEAVQKADIEAEAAEAVQKAVTEVETVRQAVTQTEAAQNAAVEGDALQTVAIRVKDAQIAVAEVEAVSKTATKEKAFQKVAGENATAEKKMALKMLAAQQNVKEQVASDLHPETIDIDVSSIPLPSPQKCPVTSEPVENSISIGASVTVAEDETWDEQSSIISPVKSSNEMLVIKNEVTEASGANSAAVNQKTAVVTSSSVAGVAKAGDLPATTDAKTLENLAIACKTTKPVNVTPMLRSSQQTFKIISINKLNASPSKTPAELLKPVKTTIKMASGKSIVCNLTQSSGSPTKVLILGNYKKVGPASTSTATATAATTVSTPASRSISLVNTTNLRITPTTLQKSAAAKKAAVALANTTGKNIVLDASTFHSLFQAQTSQLCKVQSQIVLPEAVTSAQPQISSNANATLTAAPSQSKILYMAEGGASAANSNSNCANTVVSSSNTTGQTIDYNYIVDSSGNLVQVDESPSKDKDILAKALENTDGLQTEMALSEAATNSVLDVYSIAQNTEMASKTEAVYKNLTLNTAPIMSAYETPSRVVATSNVLAEATNEKKDDEYLT